MTILPISQLQAAYGSRLDPECLVALGNSGGFSGAQIWRSFAEPALCLKQHPAGVTQPRLKRIHEWIEQVADRGVPNLAVPFRTRDGNSFMSHDQRLYEVAIWLPGIADFHTYPRRQRLAAAMEWLAEFHQAAARLSASTADRLDSNSPSMAVSPGIGRRASRCQEWSSTGIHRLRLAMANEPHDDWRQVARVLTDRFLTVAPDLQARLDRAATLPCQQNVCLRDIWHDHILFQGDTVSGVVDYDAMQVDTPAGDVARLLGSLIGNDRDEWNFGLEAYGRIRTWRPHEQELVQLFDQSSVIMAGLQWLEWLFVDRRHFDNRQGIRRRVQMWMDRSVEV